LVTVGIERKRWIADFLQRCHRRRQRRNCCVRRAFLTTQMVDCWIFFVVSSSYSMKIDT
jgi:hypothetical protein